MLPAVQHHTLSKAIITGATALALTVAAVLPAQALGKNERVFLQGVATAVIMDRVLDRLAYRTHRGLERIPCRDCSIPTKLDG